MADINAIIAFEQGELGEPEILALFQSLVDDGTAWRLQGSYGRTAVALIEAGYITDTHGVTGTRGFEDGDILIDGSDNV